MEFIQSRSILSKVSYGGQWFGIDYNMNLYRGCPHGCIYCDSRSECYGIENYDQPRGKENALLLLEQELQKKRKKGVVGLGSMSDTYNPLEKEYEQTRGALMLLLKYGFGVAIDTKSDLILRDIDLLKQISERNDAIVKITVTTPHDELSEIIEPHVCVSSERLAAIKELTDNGIFTGILMTPVLPFITDKEDDIRLLVRNAADHGTHFIYTFMSMTLRDRQRDYYFRKLDESFPGLKEKYRRCYGNRYDCVVPDHEHLWKAFIEECERSGILYKMEDIIKAYKRNRTTEQYTLF